jgi:hypothetical protein
MYGYTMMLKPQFGSTAFLHHGHELMVGSHYAAFKMFLQKQVKLFCKDYNENSSNCIHLSSGHWLFLENLVFANAASLFKQFFIY